MPGSEKIERIGLLLIYAQNRASQGQGKAKQESGLFALQL
ncbi:MAG: hypothetical protein NVSMB42_21080 [Herpetosiphon sp.]